MQMACMYPVGSVKLMGVTSLETFTSENCDRQTRDLTLCAPCESRPGRESVFILRSHNICPPSFFYGRGSGGGEYLIAVTVTGVYRSLCFVIFQIV